MPDRNIGENISLAHELVRDYKKKGKAKMCINIDLQKAYDMVNRDFVCCMLHAMGFLLFLVNLI